MKHPEFTNVVNIIEKLRDPQEGCPWDKKQTHQSLTRYLIEEAYEFIDACKRQDFNDMEDELGDILLQILLHATIGQEQGHFTIESISRRLADKMVRRHPHVFAQKNNNITAEEVKENWEKIKEQERKSNQLKSHSYLPALLAAHKIGEKTAQVGFDWQNAQEVIPIVQEELAEFLAEVDLTSTPSAALIEEYGDLLFSIAQLGRHLKINSEEALQAANNKFIRRYNQMVELIEQSGKSLAEMKQTEMDIYWKKIKDNEIKK